MSSDAPKNEPAGEPYQRPPADARPDQQPQPPTGPSTPRRPHPQQAGGADDNPWQRAAAASAGAAGPLPPRQFGRPMPPRPATQPPPATQPMQPPQGPTQPPQPAPGRPGIAPGRDPGNPQPGRPSFMAADPSGSGVAVVDQLKRRRTMIFGIAAVVLAIILVLAVVSVVHQRRTASDSAAVSDAVRGYLTALAQSDAQRARGYLAGRPADTTVLTDAALRASNRMAPLTDVRVTDPEPGEQTVHAWYKLGKHEYQQDFTVQPAGDGYLISGATATAALGRLPRGLSYKINGVSVRSGTVTLFPGSYRITSTARYLDLGAQAAFDVQPRDRLRLSVTPTLSAAGTAAARKAIGAAIDACLATTTLKAGCGLSVSDNGPGSSVVKDDTVHRHLSGDAEQQLAQLRLFLDPQRPTIIRTDGISGEVKTQARCEVQKKGKKGNKGKKKTKIKDCTLGGSGTSLATPEVTINGDKLTVSWR